MLQQSQLQEPRFVAPDPDLKSRFYYLFPLLWLLVLCILFFIPTEFKFGSLLTAVPGPVFLGYCAGQLLVYFIASGSSKDRNAKRQQAAASHARFTPSWSMDTYSWPDLTSLPSYFTVRMQRNLRATYLVAAIYFVIIAGFCLLFFFFNWQPGIERVIQTPQLLHWAIIGIAFDISFLFLMSYVLILSIIRATRQQLIATDSCLIFIAGNGKTSVIPWYEARLFAVIASAGKENEVVYELSSSTTVIRWLSERGRIGGNLYGSTYPIMGTRIFGMAQPYPSEEAYKRQTSMLNYIITARTRLYLHDLR